MNNNMILYTGQAAACGISIVACIFVILIYISARPLRIYTFKIVFWLNLSNLFTTAAFMFPAEIENFSSLLCKLDAYIMYSSSLSGFLWTFVIANKMYSSIVLDQANLDTHYSYYVTVITLVPLAICAIPFIFDAYGSIGPNCLLKDSFEGDAFRVFLYTIPGSLVFLYCCVAYARIMRVVRRKGVCEGNEIIRLKYFPIILIICLIPLFLVRILEFVGIFNFEFYVFSCVVWALHGLFDALAYAFTPPVLQYLKFVWANRSGSDISTSELFTTMPLI